MTSAETKFESVCDELCANNNHVERGKMMSSPGLKYKDKVFTFYYKDLMCFRLGRDFDPKTEEIAEWGYLSPFKAKPPMYDWVEIGENYAAKWSGLAEMALEKMKGEIG